MNPSDNPLTEARYDRGPAVAEYADDARDHAAIPARFITLEKEVELTHRLATSLHDRLGPVLAPSVPTDGPGTVAPESMESPLASNLRDLTHRVQSVQEILRNALDRLEVSQ